MLKENENMLQNVKRVHFIGIGGTGMYPIVQILSKKNYIITGSDQKESTNTLAEEKMGIKVIFGQKAENVDGADLVVYSAAISEDNPELAAAREKGIKTVERSEMLGLLTSWFDNCICVCGTHGKTTTTSMITQILLETGKDPSAFIGSKLPAIGGNGRLGKSENMVCEACEFKDTFLHLYPDIALILNIDEDHLDYFKNLENIKKSFRKFGEMTTKTIIANGDDENTMDTLKGINKEIITYGLKDSNDYYAENIKSDKLNQSYDLMYKGKKLAEIKLSVPGLHNVSNSVGACAAAILSGVKPEEIPEALVNYKGAERRFQLLGENNGVTIVDDFAHHPTEIRGTLNIAKSLGYKKVWAVFQPYTYSRMALLKDEFTEVLKMADRLVLTEIVSAREENIYDIHSKYFTDRIEGSVCFDSFEKITEYVMENAEEGDLVVTMGGGDIYFCAKMLMEYKK